MKTINNVATLTNVNGVGVIAINFPPVNALSASVRDGIHGAMQAAIADPAIDAVVLRCEGSTFIAGADITEFGKPPAGVSLGEVQRILEESPKPVVAAIHGTALGGGLEVALVCHYRIAVPTARLGLPEVNIGLLPGAGGTQRLPRIVGPEAALEMMTSGAHVRAKDALQSGLLDELAPEDDLSGAAVALARRVVDEKRPLRKIRDQNEKVEAARGHPEIFAKFRQANAKKFRGFEAPKKIIECVEAAVNLPIDEGLQLERKYFMELMKGDQSAAQRYYFFASRQAWNVPGLAKDAAILPVQSVGVIGAGTMGAGIAMNFLNVGIPVHLVETRQEALDRGLKTIRTNYENTAKKGRLTAQAIEERMALLTGSLDLQNLSDMDLVIEAVFENMDVKKDIFGRLDRICKAGAILASNTSALDLNEIASATSRPEAVIGLHFFSPANVMKLLEVVRGAKTSDSVIATSMQLAKKIGKVAVLVGVCPGFVGNRILGQRQREANALIMEGAMPWAVDRVLYDFGFPMGPFAMSDLAGLDLGWSKEKSSSSTLREVLCEMDRRGQKTGAGFYDYDEKRTAIPSPVVEEIIQRFAQKQGKQARQVSDQEILERCIYPMINEGAKILEEGMAIRASDIDVVWVNGYGWPVYRGGPMFYGDLVGLPKVLAKMKEFEASHGPQFKPAKLLEELVASGRKFSDQYVIQGLKCAVIHGAQAGGFVVSARTGCEQRDTDGISLFYVPRDTAGVTVTEYRTYDGQRGADVRLDNARVPASALIGAVGRGWEILEASTDYGVALLCAEAVGAMEAANALTLEYLKTRKQFGVPIGTFQVLQHRMADMFMHAEQAKSITILAAVKVLTAAPDERRKLVSAAKVRVGKAMRFIGQQAIQMHGGMGMTNEMSISHYFKRLTAIEVTLGNTDFHRSRFIRQPDFAAV